MKFNTVHTFEGRTIVDFEHSKIVFRQPIAAPEPPGLVLQYAQVMPIGKRVVVIKQPEVNQLLVIDEHGMDVGDDVGQTNWHHQLQKRLIDLFWLDGIVYKSGNSLGFAVIGCANVPAECSLEQLDRICADHKQMPAPWSRCIKRLGSLELVETVYGDPVTALINAKKFGDVYDRVAFKSGVYGEWMEVPV